MVEIFNRITAQVDTGTLASKAAIVIGALITEPSPRNFMLKNAETHFRVTVPSISDSFLIGIAAADASAAEIAEGMDNTGQDLEDSIPYRTGQDRVRRIWAVDAIQYDGLVAGGTVQVKINWKLPPKGIPVLKGRGLNLFCYNFNTAGPFSNGPLFRQWSKLMGGWF